MFSPKLGTRGGNGTSTPPLNFGQHKGSPQLRSSSVPHPERGFPVSPIRPTGPSTPTPGPGAQKRPPPRWGLKMQPLPKEHRTENRVWNQMAESLIRRSEANTVKWMEEVDEEEAAVDGHLNCHSISSIAARSATLSPYDPEALPDASLLLREVAAVGAPLTVPEAASPVPPLPSPKPGPPGLAQTKRRHPKLNPGKGGEEDRVRAVGKRFEFDPGMGGFASTMIASNGTEILEQNALRRRLLSSPSPGVAAADSSLESIIAPPPALDSTLDSVATKSLNMSVTSFSNHAGGKGDQKLHAQLVASQIINQPRPSTPNFDYSATHISKPKQTEELESNRPAEGLSQPSIPHARVLAAPHIEGPPSFSLQEYSAGGREAARLLGTIPIRAPPSPDTQQPATVFEEMTQFLSMNSKASLGAKIVLPKPQAAPKPPSPPAEPGTPEEADRLEVPAEAPKRQGPTEEEVLRMVAEAQEAVPDVIREVEALGKGATATAPDPPAPYGTEDDILSGLPVVTVKDEEEESPEHSPPGARPLTPQSAINLAQSHSAQVGDNDFRLFSKSFLVPRLLCEADPLFKPSEAPDDGTRPVRWKMQSESPRALRPELRPAAHLRQFYTKADQVNEAMTSLQARMAELEAARAPMARPTDPKRPWRISEAFQTPLAAVFDRCKLLEEAGQDVANVKMGGTTSLRDAEEIMQLRQDIRSSRNKSNPKGGAKKQRK